MENESADSCSKTWQVQRTDHAFARILFGHGIHFPFPEGDRTYVLAKSWWWFDMLPPSKRASWFHNPQFPKMPVGRLIIELGLHVCRTAWILSRPLSPGARPFRRGGLLRFLNFNVACSLTCSTSAHSLLISSKKDNPFRARPCLVGHPTSNHPVLPGQHCSR